MIGFCDGWNWTSRHISGGQKQRDVTKKPCQHAISQVSMPSIETEEVMAEMNFRSNSGTAGKDDLADGRFSP
jgi:hypothetical protein